MPTLIETGFGVTVMVASAAAVTVNLADPATVPDLAVITVLPTAMAWARPVVALTVPTDGVVDVHITAAVKSVVLESE